MLKRNFDFIGENLDEEKIRRIPKYEYKKWIKKKVEKAAFESYLKIKEEQSKKKLKYLDYKDFALQPYLNSNKFTHIEKKLLFSLWSKCYPAEINLKNFIKGI